LPGSSEPRRCRLLASVRSAAEAEAALAGGAHLLDVKEPAAGSLGRPNCAAIAEVVGCVADRAALPAVPISVALGELEDAGGSAIDLPAGVHFAKLGLAGCSSIPFWRDRWRQVTRALPPEVARVAVAYADWKSAESPAPNEVLQFAIDESCSALLVDTYHKSGGNLAQLGPLKSLASFVESVHSAGLISVLGGSLDAAAIRRLKPLEPAYFAFRTALCEGGRQGTVSAARVRDMVALLEDGRAS